MVLGDGQRHHVTDTATVEVSRRRVVHSVLMAPAAEGREHEHAEHGAGALAFRDGSSEPCAQSWKITKVRTRNPAATIIRTRDRQGIETPSVR